MSGETFSFGKEKASPEPPPKETATALGGKKRKPRAPSKKKPNWGTDCLCKVLLAFKKPYLGIKNENIPYPSKRNRIWDMPLNQLYPSPDFSAPCKLLQGAHFSGQRGKGVVK